MCIEVYLTIFFLDIYGLIRFYFFVHTYILNIRSDETHLLIFTFDPHSAPRDEEKSTGFCAAPKKSFAHTAYLVCHSNEM